jgi:hypothetical protein
MTLIAGFLEIFLILRYLFLYEKNFNDLELCKNWTNNQIDWIIKNKLTKKFKVYKNKVKNYFEMQDFINKFNKADKKKSNSKIFDSILKDKDNVKKI